jgi:hypothetical protein
MFLGVAIAGSSGSQDLAAEGRPAFGPDQEQIARLRACVRLRWPAMSLG